MTILLVTGTLCKTLKTLESWKQLCKGETRNFDKVYLHWASGNLQATVQRRKNSVMYRSMQDLASIAFDICQGHKIQALRNGRQSASELLKAGLCLHDTQAMLPADMPKSSNPHCIYLLSQTAATLAVGLAIPARNSQQSTTLCIMLAAVACTQSAQVTKTH